MNRKLPLSAIAWLISANLALAQAPPASPSRPPDSPTNPSTPPGTPPANPPDSPTNPGNPANPGTPTNPASPANPKNSKKPAKPPEPREIRVNLNPERRPVRRLPDRHRHLLPRPRLIDGFSVEVRVGKVAETTFPFFNCTHCDEFPTNEASGGQ